MAENVVGLAAQLSTGGERILFQVDDAGQVVDAAGLLLDAVGVKAGKEVFDFNVLFLLFI